MITLTINKTIWIQYYRMDQINKETHILLKIYNMLINSATKNEINYQL